MRTLGAFLLVAALPALLLTQNFPQPGPGIPGFFSGSLYSGATACWSFDDPTDLGNDDCTNTYDLTLVNTPTAGGGALGYAADFEAGSSQYADVADNATLSHGARDFAYVYWIRPESLAFEYHICKEDALTAAGFEFGIRHEGAGDLEVVVGDGTDLHNPLLNVPTVFTAGVRAMVYVYNEDGVGVGASIDDGAISTAANLHHVSDATGAWTIGRVETAPPGTYLDGVIGPVLRYNVKPSSAVVTSLYNSGKGKLCSELSGAELTGLAACWDMSEDGGPYADSIGSNTLTGVNTPTQAAGLVERSDSGMAVASDGSSNQALTNATIVDQFAGGSGSFFMWAFEESTGNKWKAGNTAGGWSSTFEMYTNAGTLSGAFYNDDEADLERDYLNHQTGFTISEWHHIGFTYNSATKTSTIYLDGVAGTTTSVLSDGLNWDGSPDFDLLDPGLVWGPTQGVQDNAAFWPKVLSSAEIATLYNSGAGDFYAALNLYDFLNPPNAPRFAWSMLPVKRFYVGEHAR